MYWPVGTPQTYATSNNVAPTSVHLSHDASPNPDASARESPAHIHAVDTRPPQPQGDEGDELAPKTPITPAIPAVRSVENELDGTAPTLPTRLEDGVGDAATRMREPILALKVSRTGHIFAVATATTMTVWQTKVRCRCFLPSQRSSRSKPGCLRSLPSF